jgi:hypothetical protein
VMSGRSLFGSLSLYISMLGMDVSLIAGNITNCLFVAFHGEFA